MVDVFVCHAARDREVAAAIKSRLEPGAECRVWTEECPGQTVAELWDGGLSCAAIILILSPDSVPPRVDRKDWESLLQHVGRNDLPPVGCVVSGDCKYPALLDRRRLFRWEAGANETLRALHRWVLSLHGDRRPEAFAPARLPWFEGHENELESLWDRLVDGSGTVTLSGDQSWAIAQEFARSAADHFRETIWVDCEGRSPASILGELAGHLGTTSPQVAQVIGAHRILVVLDGVEGEPPVSGRGSILVIAKRDEPPRLPEAPQDPLETWLWRAAQVCRRNRFSLDLAADIAGLSPEEMLPACEGLVRQRYLAPLDLPAGLYRRTAAAESLDEALQRRHAEILPSALAGNLAELDSALPWAIEHDWDLAVRMADRAFRFLEARGRTAEAVQVYEDLRWAARDRGDAAVEDRCARALRWFRDEDGYPAPLVQPGEQASFEF